MTTDFPHDKAPASPAPVTAVPYLTAAAIKALTDEQLDAAVNYPGLKAGACNFKLG